MAMKEWVRRMQPFQLYVVLVLTIIFFLIELIVSHLTHALTLLMDSYHMLCNIMALGGCIVTIKYAKQEPTNNFQKNSSSEEKSEEELASEVSNCHDQKKTQKSVTGTNEEKKLKNTFGWARTDVIFMLICCVFLASLSFSILVEALQTLVHIDHHDEMHHPISVLCLGAAGILLNGVTYLLIGGYTFHQGSFLYVTKSGDVVLSKVVIDQALAQGARRLSRSRTIHPTIVPQKQRQGLWEMTRDINGCVLVIICALLVFFINPSIAKYIDPVIAIISSTLIMFLSYPYMKESCLILLQTMPDTINIDTLKIELLNHFPDIVNIHDFHIWQLTASKIISTVHIIFQNPKVYQQVIEEVKEFFMDNGISQVTIQPEFFKKNASMESVNSKYTPNCLVSCIGEECKQNHCCPAYQEKSISKSISKETLPESLAPDLKSVRIIDEDIEIISTNDKSSEITIVNPVIEDKENITITEDEAQSDPPSYETATEQSTKSPENNTEISVDVIVTNETVKDE